MKAAVEELVSLCRAGTALLAVVTREEERALVLCSRAAKALDGTSYTWSMTRGLLPVAEDARDLEAMLNVLLPLPGPALVAVLDPLAQLESPRARRALKDALPVLMTKGIHLVMVSPSAAVPPDVAADTAVLRLPLPDAAELMALVKERIKDARLLGQAGAEVTTLLLGLTLQQASRALARARAADANLGDAARLVLQQEKRRYLFEDVGLEFVEDTVEPALLGGLGTFKAWLLERSAAFHGQGGPGVDTPRGVLLVGVQGCGKSLAAKCAAAQLGVPLVRLDLPRVMGASGQGLGAEETLARALHVVENMAPVALWLDEVEKTFAGANKGVDARAARVLGAFSTWLQERSAPVFVVATANDVSSLPPELLRRGRLDETFFVDLPDQDARKEILALHLRRRGVTLPGLDLADLAQACGNFTGAELEQVVVAGLHRAHAANRPVSSVDLRRAAQDMVPLATVYEEEIKQLRDWARPRARAAGKENALVELFRRVPAKATPQA